MKELYTIGHNLRLAALLLLISFFPAKSFADSYFDTGESSINLITDSYQVNTKDTLLVGIEFKLSPGWHTYWKNPGDSGEGATIKWDLPSGFKASAVLWPGPDRIPVDPLMTFGYEDKALLLTKIKAPDQFAGPVTISAKVNWLTCKDICIPQEGEVDLTLMKGPKTISEFSTKLEEIALTVPKNFPQPGRATEINEKIILQLEKEDSSNISQAYFFPSEYGLISYVGDQKLERNDNSFSLELNPAEVRVETNGFKGVLKLKTDETEEFYNLDLPLERSSNSPILAMSLLTSILFAFLGGIILNAMPCVFPILSIKILSFIEQSQGSKKRLIQHGLIFSAGVLTTFLTISWLLIFLKASGEAIGWGYQLQSPWVVSLLIYLFVAIGIVFMGNIVLGSSLANFGSLTKNRNDLLSSFFTGVLAVIVASPCTAPFMGPAIGLALLQPGLNSIVIFLALGAGFSLPYLMLTMYPQLLSKLPKPGEWMQTFKQIMAFPMWAAALWLVWVLSAQVNMQAVFAVLIGALLIALALWLMEKTQSSGQLLRRVTVLFSLSLMVFSIWLIPFNQDDASSNLRNEVNEFSAQKLNSLRSEKKAIFVNFTADWCITCKVNEAIALDQDNVKKLLQEKDIVYLEADWTRKDSEIASVLATYGRTGVPLYLLFPSVGDPIILPELLTEDLLLDFLIEIN
ncbi:MAG: protein-disulfide reductase DsbD family protein [SAR86 cluster bacterium]|nr:protein-disulfide reductase DsbD family protein [SAR86 cluster bacterium]